MTKLSFKQQKMLKSPFMKSRAPREAIGVEIEVGVVDPVTGVSRPYAGRRGVGEFLRRAAEHWNGKTYYEGPNIIGFKRRDGTDVGLESGCALEYGSTAETSLFSVVQKSNRDIMDLATIAARMDLALLSGAMLPFDTRQDVHWAPKARIPLMLDHFEREIGSTSQGWAAMAQIITVQTTLDYIDADDLQRKYRMANVATPFVAALFVNSPMQASQLTDVQSRRMQIWADVDSRRVGMFEHSISWDFSVDALIEWAVQLPMIHRIIDGQVRPAPPYLSFESLLTKGFADGSWPELPDWLAMLNTTWPYVRLRRTLELRIADGLSHEHWPAAPALWTGLTYDRDACEAAWAMLSGYSLKGYLEAVDDVARRGLDACIEGHPIRPLCEELLNISKDGLARRVGRGLEPEDVLSYLGPLFEVVKSGTSFATQLARNWRENWAEVPARYVEYYRYPAVTM